MVQKLIDKLETRQQISLVVSALKPGLLDLIKDQNGNHVIQCCLQRLDDEDNKVQLLLPFLLDKLCFLNSVSKCDMFSIMNVLFFFSPLLHNVVFLASLSYS